VTADHQLTATLAKDYRFTAGPAAFREVTGAGILPAGSAHRERRTPNADRLTAQAIEIAVVHLTGH
jgi:hypothetical protein